ncbi:MAG: glycosyltransferase, partial [Bacteroidota bacterium]
VIVFHTVLPHPDEGFKLKVQRIAAFCRSIIVMTHNSAGILTHDYDIPVQKISVIAHGTHLVPHLSDHFLKSKYGLQDRKVLSTFGLLSSGKGIETTLEALPAIIREHPEVVFLILGKTHPEVKKSEGEKYREMLKERVAQDSLQEHVIFINQYLELDVLLEYLQLTDIYLFTANDPNQAVSGTFAYAMSCACPIISTPIPHARELITDETGIIFDFRNPMQLADGVLKLLNNEPLRINISTNSLEKIVSTAWENSAVAHARLFERFADKKFKLQYDLPVINLDHIKKLTTNTGMIQFSKINQPDIESGNTLDDNARALIAMAMHYKTSGDKKSLIYISRYLDFIGNCQQPGGDFFNYVNKEEIFTYQNETVNLDDSNGRAVWALGYLISLRDILPHKIYSEASAIFKQSLFRLGNVHSTRAMAFALKGLFFAQSIAESPAQSELSITFANRLVQMFRHESSPGWEWFEGYLTYANSILPESMLLAWLLTGNNTYREIARSSMNFLLSQIFNRNGIEVISNRKWLQRGEVAGHFGEQPIDVAYTIMTLSRFYDVFGDEQYLRKMETAFDWFLGRNRLHQIIYNPCTGGCYDGLEENHVNLNQGAESTVSYLMARLTVQKYSDHIENIY